MINECKGELIIGIDASRNRSGGGRTHLIGILTEGSPSEYGIKEVHIWAYKTLIDALPEREWIFKHTPCELEQSLLWQVWWQRFRLPIVAKKCGCSILLNTDAGTVCRFRPSITMSRDMLSYEPGVIEKFGFGIDRLRLVLLKYIQKRSLCSSEGTIFLTKYAADVIQSTCGGLPRIAIIPHGIGTEFKTQFGKPVWPKDGERRINLLYISTATLYKNQWVVIHGIEFLRNRGYDVGLRLVGGGSGKPQRLLEKQIKISDPNREWVEQIDFIPQKALPEYLAKADLFIFASSCENMPNTLVEAMAAGLPIACSNRGPMPEILSDGGVYFDPENAESIAATIERLIVDESLRLGVAWRAKELSEQYSWARCAKETFSFIVEIVSNSKNA